MLPYAVSKDWFRGECGPVAHAVSATAQSSTAATGPWISTPSNPASRANRAARTNAART
jgi:hypothetical protein